MLQVYIEEVRIIIVYLINSILLYSSAIYVNLIYG